VITDPDILCGTRSFLCLNFRRIRRAARSQRIVIALIIVFSFAGSALIGWIAGIPQPHLTDEFSYLLAADTFAHGRLTNATHPMWMHFESLHIIQRPTYMSKYPPAQGLILAAGQVIGGHPIVGVWLSFAVMCGAIAWMLYAWLPPRWAVLGALLAIINPQLGIAGYWAQSYWGGAVAATGGALVLGGLRRLMRQPRMRTSLALAIGLAILANSRPYEGLFLGLSAVIYLSVWMLGKRGPTLLLSTRQVVMPILTVLGLTAMAMGYYNYRVSGNALRLPYQIHKETYAVTPLFVWQSLRSEPRYRHEDIREYHTRYVRDGYLQQLSITGLAHKASKIASALTWQFLNVYLLPIIAVLPLFLRWAWHSLWARFALYTSSLVLCAVLVEVHWAVHYLAPITALNYFLIVSAMRWCRYQQKTFGRVVVAGVALVAVLALMASLQTRTEMDDSLSWSAQRARLLAQFRPEDGRHLLVVRYHTNDSRHPVWEYNEANIDSAKMIWARTMNQHQNCTLMKYFNDRHIWSVDISGDQSKPYVKVAQVNFCT
jgi:hypothetical protein